MNSDVRCDFVNNNYSSITSSSVIFNCFHLYILCSIFILHFLFDDFSLIVCDTMFLYNNISGKVLLFISEASKTVAKSKTMFSICENVFEDVLNWNYFIHVLFWLCIAVSTVFFFSNRDCCSTVVLCLPPCFCNKAIFWYLLLSFFMNEK